MNELSIDPDRIRGFANDVKDRFDTDFQGRIAEIRTHMGGRRFTLGSGTGAGEQYASDYSGRGVGAAMGSSITEGLAWLKEVEAGLEALALAGAVFEETLATGDVLNAEDLESAAEPGHDGSSDAPPGGGKDQYVV